MAGLQDFYNALAEALAQAGIDPSQANVAKAVQVWNQVNGASMSREDFVQALRYTFTAAGIPVGQQPQATQPTPATPAQSEPYQSPTVLEVQPGLEQQNWAEEQAQYLHIMQLQFQTQMDIASINAAADRYIAELSAAVQREVAAGNWSNDQAIAAMQIASQEAMFAKNLALQQLISDREYEVNKAQLDLQEREYKAGLAANPADWLTYQAFLGGGELPGSEGASALATGQAAPATIQQIAEGLTSGQNTLYNPALTGVGVAGAHVPGPQELSRAEAYNMTPTDIQMLQGFLKSGIEINGKRVAINPEDWFQQAGRSWIPFTSSESFTPEYSF